ncbi:MAG TPA: phosphoribosylanthranilate isomerase [Candidatus Acidoferrum sp.]
MTLIKICGITNLADALAACEAGADVIGLNFYRLSPRMVSVEDAREIRTRLPAGVRTFGVFVNEESREILRVMREVGLDALQLHGDEEPGVVTELAPVAPVFKALRVGADFSAATLEKYADAAGFLFDAAEGAAGQYGGTGRLADWGVAQQAARGHRIFLAGGLSPENVGAAIAQVRPYGVDVASGVESAPGLKDHERLREFIVAARQADRVMNPTAEKIPTR